MFPPDHLRIAFFLLLLGSACGYAFWRGAAPERLAAAALIAATLATVIAARLNDRLFVDHRFLLFAINGTLFLGLLWLALHADRYWTMWVAALQLAQLGVDIAVQFDTHIIAWTYVIMHALWGYIAVTILAAGTFRHRRRVLAGWPEPSWSVVRSQAR